MSKPAQGSSGGQETTGIPSRETLTDGKPYTNPMGAIPTDRQGIPSVDEPFRLLADALQDARLRHVDGRHGQPQLLGRLRAADAVEGQAPEGSQRDRLELLFHQVQQAAEHVAVVFLVPLPIQLAVGVGDLLEGGGGAAAAAGLGARVDGPPVIGRAAADDGAQPGAKRAPVAGVLESRAGA